MNAVPDVLPAVTARFHELCETPVARGLREVRIGPTDLWDVIQYDVADALYDEAYRHASQVDRGAALSPPEGRRAAYHSVVDSVTRNLWQGQVGQEYLVGVLSARLGFIGDLLERGIAGVHGRRRRPNDRTRGQILIAGSMYRRAVAALRFVVEALRHDYDLEHLVLAHDDVLGRHGRAFTDAGLHWLPATRFRDRTHPAIAKRFSDSARKALENSLGREHGSLPNAVLQRTISPRSLRRLAENFLAVQSALQVVNPAVVVIPDERQPLARLVGLEAGRRGLPVVAAPLDRDQIFRKTPLIHPSVSTRTFVSSGLAARFIGRGGVSPNLFALARLSDDAADNRAGSRSIAEEYRRLLHLDSRTRVVLFASQGQASNAVILPMLAGCVAMIPGCALVIRPHPYEWPPLVKLMNRRVRVSAHFDTRSAIQASDVLVTHSSHMAVEAVRLGHPVILVSPDPIPQLLPLISEGLATWVCTKSALSDALVQALRADRRDDEAQIRFRRDDELTRGPRHAAGVIADLARSNGRLVQHERANPVGMSA